MLKLICDKWGARHKAQGTRHKEQGTMYKAQGTRNKCSCICNCFQLSACSLQRAAFNLQPFSLFAFMPRCLVAFVFPTIKLIIFSLQ